MAKKINVGLKNKVQKIRLFNDKIDSTFNELGKSQITMISNRKIIIDGCQGVIDYDEDFISLNLGKKLLSVVGFGMEIVDFSENQLTFVGEISRVEFGE